MKAIRLQVIERLIIGGFTEKRAKEMVEEGNKRIDRIYNKDNDVSVKELCNIVTSTY